MELEFIILDLAQQNRVSHTWDVILLNSFENVLINEIVWILVLFWKKILQIPFTLSFNWLCRQHKRVREKDSPTRTHYTTRKTKNSKEITEKNHKENKT